MIEIIQIVLTVQRADRHMFMKNKKLAIIIFVAVVCVAAVVALKLRPETPLITKDITGKHVGLTTFHAQLQDPLTGCTKCHTTPPTNATCATCHPSPPTTITGGISFPHHNTAQHDAPTTCQASTCHAGTPNDVRFVVKPTIGHTYCQNCHSLEHSLP